jgi:hypothetical protein
MVAVRKIKKRLDKQMLASIKERNKESKESTVAREDMGKGVAEAIQNAVGNFQSSMRNELQYFDAPKQDHTSLANVEEVIDQGVKAEIKAAERAEGRLDEMQKNFANTIRQGVLAELKVISNENKKTYQQTLKGIEEAIRSAIEVTKGNAEMKTKKMSEVDGEEEPSIEEKAKKLIGTKDESLVSDRKMSVGDFLKTVALGTIGADEYAERSLEEKNRKEQFITSKQSLDSTKTREELEQEYSEIKTKKEELETIQKRIDDLKASGNLSKEELEALPEMERRKQLVTELSPDERQAVTPQPIMTEDGTRGVAVIPMQDEKTGSGVSAATEEELHEQRVLQEKEFDEVESQTGLLAEIRDLLKDPKRKVTEDKKEEGGGNETSTGPDIDINRRTTRTPSRTPKTPRSGGLGGALKSAAKTAGRVALNVVKSPAFIPAAVIGGSLAMAYKQNEKDKEYFELYDKVNNKKPLTPEEQTKWETLKKEKDEASWVKSHDEMMEMTASGPTENKKGTEAAKSAVGASTPTVTPTNTPPKPGAPVDVSSDKEILTRYAKEEAERFGRTTPNSEDRQAASLRLRKERSNQPPVVKDEKRLAIGANEYNTSNADGTASPGTRKYMALQKEKVEMLSADTKSVKPIPEAVKEPPAKTETEMAAAIAKNINIQAPPPTVIQSGNGGGNQLLPTPFANGIRHNEPTINRYIGARHF